VNAVDAPHGSEGAHAAREAAGQLLHLADLALVLGDLVHGHAEGRHGVDLVNVLAGAKQFQLVVAGTGQPRVHARLDGRPIRRHQHLAGRRQQGRAQHPLQHVRDALAVARHDLMCAHHGLPHVVGRLGALAREVVDLQAVAAGPACGSAAGEDKRAAHPLVLGVGQRRRTAKLGHAAGPQVIGALDHLGHVGRHFVGVLIGQCQQVGAHGLVDRHLGHPVLPDGH